jgi:endonuclease YncB( thermonuclease family)
MRAMIPSPVFALRPLATAAALLALLGTVAAEPVSAEEGAETCESVPGESGRVARILDGATLALEDGLVVRLAALLPPEPPLGTPRADWPLAAKADAALGRLALGRVVTLAYPDAGRDRYGRAVAIVTIEGDRTPLGEAMLAEGLARVMPADEPHACLAPLLATEREAREKQLGLWADPYYAIRAARDPALAERADTYDLVEGRVLSVGVRGPIAYLDFGRNWRTDFTAVIAGPATRALTEAGMPPTSLEGRRVRVRGWIEQHDGPSLRVTHPAELELLDDGD